MVYNLITSFTSEEVVLQSELYNNLEQKTCQFIIIYYVNFRNRFTKLLINFF